MRIILPDRPVVSDYSFIVRLSMLFCMVLFALMLGLNHQLLTLILKVRGFNETAIGISAAMAPLGILISSLLVTWATSKLLASYVAIIGLLLAAFSMLAMYIFSDYYLWLVLRFLLGVGINVTFIIGEAWVNESAKEASRGKVLAIYMALLSASFALGPAIIAVVGIDSFAPFGIGVGLCIIAILPMYYFRYKYPDFPQSEHKISAWQFLPLAPALLFSIFIVTLMDQGLLALLSLYGLAYGLPQQQAVLLVTYLVLGTVIVQYPVGVVADMLPNRRYATLGCAVLATIGFFLIPYSMVSPYLYIPLITFTGGISFAIYTLGMTELGHRFSGATLLAGTACFSLIWGFGGLFASPIAGAMMENIGADYLMYLMGGLYLILVFAIGLRLSKAEDIHTE